MRDEGNGFRTASNSFHLRSRRVAIPSPRHNAQLMVAHEIRLSLPPRGRLPISTRLGLRLSPSRYTFTCLTLIRTCHLFGGTLSEALRCCRYCISSC
jgi:hypothetical protein